MRDGENNDGFIDIDKNGLVGCGDFEDDKIIRNIYNFTANLPDSIRYDLDEATNLISCPKICCSICHN
jgi:hypothetical protein